MKSIHSTLLGDKMLISGQEVKTIKAYLKSTISYVKDGQEVQIKKDTAIKVDIEKQIALIDGDHIDISIEEYIIPS